LEQRILERIFKKVVACTVLVEVLLFADFLSTHIIFAFGGVELNPIVNAIGLGVISLLNVLGFRCWLAVVYWKKQ
jgi:hypothetical protein